MDSKKIGEIIAGQRARLNLTQTTLAEKLMISPKTVSKWESGRGLPSIDILPELSKVLEISIDELLCNEIKETKKSYDVKEMGLIKFLSPKYVNFSEPINNALKEAWLEHILKEEKISLSEFQKFVEDKRESINNTIEIKEKFNEKGDIKMDFDKIELLNSNFSEEKKVQAISLLKACSPNQSSQIVSLISCIERENIEKVLARTGNRLNVECYNINDLGDFEKEIKIENAKNIFIVFEANENEQLDILDYLLACKFEADTEIAVWINNFLETRCRVTLFYA